jgi:uncharacterized membrane protein YbhN (UPF0104 family)
VIRLGQRLREVIHRQRVALAVLGTAGGAGLVIVALAGRWHEFAAAAAGAPWWILSIAAALQVAALVARSEAWNVSVRAAGGTVGRRRLYRAASVGYVGNIANGELGFAMRIAALRRSAPRQTPKPLALAATEVPILVVEATMAALTSFTLVGPLGLPWWMPLGVFGATVAALLGLRWIARNHRRGAWQGLAVMRDARARNLIVAFVLIVIGTQIARNWLLLHASGVNVSVFDATAVLIAVAALGVLPLGPSVGVGSAVLILGADGVPAVAAAGVLLTATAAVGALAYGGWAIADRQWSRRLTLPTTAGSQADPAGPLGSESGSCVAARHRPYIPANRLRIRGARPLRKRTFLVVGATNPNSSTTCARSSDLPRRTTNDQDCQFSPQPLRTLQGVVVSSWSQSPGADPDWTGELHTKCSAPGRIRTCDPRLRSALVGRPQAAS